MNVDDESRNPDEEHELTGTDPKTDTEDTVCQSEMLADVFRMLNDPDRRQMLSLLAEDSTISLDALLETIATRGAGRSERSDEREVRRLRIEFLHQHLPLAQDMGFVEFDEETGTISSRKRSPAVEHLLRLSREHDR